MNYIRQVCLVTLWGGILGIEWEEHELMGQCWIDYFRTIVDMPILEEYV